MHETETYLRVCGVESKALTCNNFNRFTAHCNFDKSEILSGFPMTVTFTSERKCEICKDYSPKYIDGEVGLVF